jgi:hypothetical protein
LSPLSIFIQSLVSKIGYNLIFNIFLRQKGKSSCLNVSRGTQVEEFGVLEDFMNCLFFEGLGILLSLADFSCSHDDRQKVK